MKIIDLTGLKLTARQSKGIRHFIGEVDRYFSKDLTYRLVVSKESYSYYGKIEIKENTLNLKFEYHSLSFLDCISSLLVEIEQQHRNNLRTLFSQELLLQITTNHCSTR